MAHTPYKNRRTNNSGLTLIGVLMSIMVFAIGMTALMVLLVQSQAKHSESLHYMEARFLAQEGLEVIRNIRDSNWRQNYDWDHIDVDFTSNCYEKYIRDTQPNQGSYYVIALHDNTACPWSVKQITTPPLTNEGDLQYLVPNPNNRPMNYYRALSFQYLDAKKEELLVESTVYWYEQGKVKHVDMSTVLTNWRNT